MDKNLYQAAILYIMALGEVHKHAKFILSHTDLLADLNDMNPGTQAHEITDRLLSRYRREMRAQVESTMLRPSTQGVFLDLFFQKAVSTEVAERAERELRREEEAQRREAATLGGLPVDVEGE